MSFRDSLCSDIPIPDFTNRQLTLSFLMLTLSFLKLRQVWLALKTLLVRKKQMADPLGS
jgi:hypothetical protein